MDTKKLRQKILDLAIHGKLVPQDPNDEPASVLLERIRAEKERLIAEGKIKRSKKFCANREQSQACLNSAEMQPRLAKGKSASSDTPHYENVPFEVPENWIWIDLNSICSKIVDGDHNPPSGEDRPTRYRMLSSKNINYNTIVDIDDCRYLSEQDWKICHSRTRLNKGDVLLTTVATLGRSCVVETDEPICFQRSVTIITTLIYNKYLKYIFDSNYYQELMTDTAKGTAQKGFYINQVSTSIIPLPPLAEQMRIVHAVSQWISFIDSIESSTTDLFQSIQSTKAKILDLAIHGKLVPQDDNDEPASVLLKRINPKAVASCDNPHYENTPYNIPQSWCWQSLKSISSQISTKKHQIPTKEVEQSGLIPVVSQSTQIIDGYSNDSGRRVTDIPIILFGDHTRVVKYLDFEFVVGADGTKLIKSHIFDKYLYYWVKATAGHIRDRGYGRHFALLNQEPVPIPPLLEQKRIVARIDELFLLLDLIEKSLQA